MSANVIQTSARKASCREAQSCAFCVHVACGSPGRTSSSTSAGRKAEKAAHGWTRMVVLKGRRVVSGTASWPSGGRRISLTMALCLMSGNQHTDNTGCDSLL